jgi:cytochrome c peroxidase
MMIALVLVGASVLRPTPAFATPVEERIVEDPLGAEAHALNRALRDRLREIGFTGSVEATLPERLGRPINRKLATVGRLLWFDTVTGLNDDNSCGGCHSPTNGFGDTQSIAIGIENNNLVGPSRTGPRNQRRAPMVINNAFFPTLMWNSRFASLSGDPFDNSGGLSFPAPESLTLSYLPHLLTAQAFIPPTERNEVAGFDFVGDNFAIREEVLNRLNAIPEYVHLFGRVFPEVQLGAPIDFDMFGQAIAEFEFTLTFTDTPLDRFARSKQSAMTNQQKRGALLFFGEAGCVSCHAVSGGSNEMFSDFQQHVLAVPQVSPDVTNSVFDGPGANEDFGLEQVTGNADHRYMFRTSPLRNLAMQTSFFHNGAFTTIEDAVRHHLDVFESARNYDPGHLDEDLRGPVGPIEPALARVDPLLSQPIELSESEFEDLVAFLREGLLDKRALPKNLMKLIPREVPSGRPVMIFEEPAALVAEELANDVEAAAVRPTRPEPASVAVAVNRLQQNYPNPFNPSTTIAFSLAARGRVSLVIYDALGARVRSLLDDVRDAGVSSVGWDGRGDEGTEAASGVYFCRMVAGSFNETRRLVLVR